MCTIVTIFSALLFTENSAVVISIYRSTVQQPIPVIKGDPYEAWFSVNLIFKFVSYYLLYQPATGGVGSGLSFDQVADDIRRNGVSRFLDYVSSPHYGSSFFVNAAQQYFPQNFQNWKLAPRSVNFGRKVGRWGHQFFPNPNYGELRHIIGSFVISEKYNPITAYNVTWGNEYIGLSLDIRNLRSRINGSEWAFQYSDVFNNYKGIWYSIKY